MADMDIGKARESAEGLYDSAVEMAEILEVFERAGFPRIDSSTMQRMEHNVINARSNLANLAALLGIDRLIAVGARGDATTASVRCLIVEENTPAVTVSASKQPDCDTLDAAAQLAYAMALE